MARIPIDTSRRTFIYTLEDPDTHDVRYIGKTVKDLRDRLTGHLYTCRKKNNYRCNWIKSIVNKGKKPIIKAIDSCAWSESQELEMYWISQFRSWGFNLVNSTNGGEGHLGLKLTQERLDKLILANSKTVYQYDLNGIFIQEFSSCQEAANYLGIKSNSKIAACARGLRGKSANYMWSYERHETLPKYKRHKNGKTPKHSEGTLS